MEEASVAGESPDRSKQRESSAEPTPGGEGPVPEARDPRLTVARAAEPDTTTKVLSTRETPKEDDARLRAAVAAWVRTDPSETPTEGPTESEDTTKATEDDSETKGSAERRGEAVADAGDDDSEAPDATEDDSEAASDDTDAEGAVEGRGKTAADAEDDDSEAPDATEDDGEAASDDTDAEGAVEGRGEAAADAGGERESGGDSEAEEASSTGELADEADATEGDDRAESDDATAAAADESSDDEDARAGTDELADADGEDAPQGPPAPDDATRTGGAGGSETPDGEAEDDAPANAPQAGVDQPTAVFKAVRPTPQVDQPTTTLKVPGAPKSKFVPLKPPSDATALVPQVGPERTTQQPLPPKPPLDLLAELTNTPPPPQTPFRTLVRRIKIWTPLVILLAIIFAVVQSVRPLPQPTLDLTAQDSYTFDGDKVTVPWPAQGQAALDVQGIGSFGSSGDQKPVPIASVAKVMTAYIILRDHPLESGADGPKIKIDQAAQDQSDAGQESTVQVTAGDAISQREALESILIASANNVARLLARWDAGSEKAFVAKMNATAKGLGMTNTTYTDPSGLTDSTVSTAVDQVKLAKAAMEKPVFREVAAMMSYDDYKGENHSNWNHLVGSNNVVGIKTGTTTSALGNLVFAAKKDVGGETRTIVGAVLRQPAGGPDNTILGAALYGGDQLIRAAQGALRSATIIKKGTVVGTVDDGLGGRTPVIATEDVTAVGWSGLKVRLSFAADDVPHTAKAGTKVGTLTVGDGSGGAVKVPVALRKDLAEPGFTDKLTRLG